MQVAVETLTTREKRRDLCSAVFDQKQSVDDARCHVGCPQHEGVRRCLRCAGLRKLASPARLTPKLRPVVAELGNDSHRDKERERRGGPALQRLRWSGAGHCADAADMR